MGPRPGRELVVSPPLHLEGIGRGLERLIDADDDGLREGAGRGGGVDRVVDLHGPERGTQAEIREAEMDAEHELAVGHVDDRKSRGGVLDVRGREIYLDGAGLLAGRIGVDRRMKVGPVIAQIALCYMEVRIDIERLPRMKDVRRSKCFFLVERGRHLDGRGEDPIRVFPGVVSHVRHRGRIVGVERRLRSRDSDVAAVLVR